MTYTEILELPKEFSAKKANKQQDIRIEGTDLAENKPVLELCNHHEQLTNPLFDGYDGVSGYCGVHTPAYLTIDLEKPQDIGLIQFLLFDSYVDNNHGYRERLYYYRILAARDQSCDKDNWEWTVIYDTGRVGRRNWQFIHIPEGLREVRYLRIHCMYSQKNTGFHIVRFRVYSPEDARQVSQAELHEQLTTPIEIPHLTQWLYPFSDFRESLGKGVFQTSGLILPIDKYITRTTEQEQQADLGLFLSDLSKTPDFEASAESWFRTLDQAKITKNSRFPRDRANKSLQITVSAASFRTEIGDGFLLSKRIHDIMNRIRLIEDDAAKDPNKELFFAIESKHLKGINPVVAKKMEAFRTDNRHETELTWSNIRHILDSLADDIAIMEQDTKNTERIVLNPINVELGKGNDFNKWLLLIAIATIVISTILLPTIHALYAQYAN